MRALSVSGMCIGFLLVGSSLGQQAPSRSREQPLRLSQAAVAEDQPSPTAAETAAAPAEGGYREVSSFFNVREANANVEQGEWELEVGTGWVTHSDGSDDDYSIWPSLKYGLTNDLYVELEVLPLNLGDGGDQGNGDLGLTVFWQFLHEEGIRPAMATWAEMRIPSGEGSSGVDGEFHISVTKSLSDRWRAHLEGWVETANGGRGDEDENRRHFQWGLGPGIDYQIDDKTIALLNYLHRSSEEYGHHNQNILEIGAVRELTETQHLKAAIDIGLDGAEETPNFAAKLQWTIEWMMPGQGR